MKKPLFLLLIVSSYFRIVIAQDITSFPYFTGFEGVEGTLNENFPAGWTSEDLNTISFGNQGWQIIKNTGTTINARTDSTAIHMFSHGSQTNDDWLYTPSIQMTAGNRYTLSFWYRINSFGNTSERLKVHIGETNIASEMITNDPIWDDGNITNTEYREARIDYTPNSSGTYYFGFHYYSLDFQFLLLLDDITIAEDVISSVTPSLSKNQYRLMKNPVEDQIQLQFSSAITSPAIANLYDLSGRSLKAVRLEPGAWELSLNVHDLPDGYYILRVLTRDRTWQLQEKIIVTGHY